MILTCAQCNHPIWGSGIDREVELGGARARATCGRCGYRFWIDEDIAVPAPTDPVYTRARDLTWQESEGAGKVVVVIDERAPVAGLVFGVLTVFIACAFWMACESLTGYALVAVHVVCLLWGIARASLHATRISIDAEAVTISDIGPVVPRFGDVMVQTTDIERFVALAPSGEESSHSLSIVLRDGEHFTLKWPSLPSCVHRATFVAARLSELVRRLRRVDVHRRSAYR